MGLIESIPKEIMTEKTRSVTAIALLLLLFVGNDCVIIVYHCCWTALPFLFGFEFSIFIIIIVVVVIR